MGHDLFGNHFRPAGPCALGMRVPENLHRLVDVDLPEFGLINKCAYTDVMQIGHLREQVSFLHEITRMDGQGIQRAIERRGPMRRGDFFLEVANLSLRMFDQ